MQIIKINPKNPEELIIKKTAGVLKSSGLIVYPTDTAYGLGGNALDEEVIRRIYEAKGRDFSKPTHVAVADWEMIDELCFVNETAKKLYDKFFPGPLTIILPKKKIVPDILTAGLPTLGVRIPNHLITLSLNHLTPFPYTTPSANKSGGKTPYSIDDVKKELDISKIDLILDAGVLPQVPPSAIVDLTTSPPKLIREGPILKIELEKILKIKLTT